MLHFLVDTQLVYVLNLYIIARNFYEYVNASL